MKNKNKIFLKIMYILRVCKNPTYGLYSKVGLAHGALSSFKSLISKARTWSKIKNKKLWLMNIGMVWSN